MLSSHNKYFHVRLSQTVCCLPSHDGLYWDYRLRLTLGLGTPILGHGREVTQC